MLKTSHQGQGQGSGHLHVDVNIEEDVECEEDVKPKGKDSLMFVIMLNAKKMSRQCQMTM